ncbi:MAG TPA: TlyA family RNA methyltransferase [Limnochordales bacterium]
MAGDRPTDGGRREGRSGRVRVDRLLVDRGLAASREQARRAVQEGRVRVGSQVVQRPGMRVDPGACVQVEGEAAFVSRGGRKLAHALDVLGVDVQGAVAMDVGASTGGFTDCLLQRGARKVYAVDVGYGQLAWKLRTDPRVVVMERTNVRYLEPEQLGEPLDLITVDVAFISVTKFLCRLGRFLRDGGRLLVLVKPQFEAGRGQVGRGGVVRDDATRARVLRQVIQCAGSCGFALEGLVASPLLGPQGNAEFFALFRWPAPPRAELPGLDGLIDEVLRQAPDRLAGAGRQTPGEGEPLRLPCGG